MLRQHIQAPKHEKQQRPAVSIKIQVLLDVQQIISKEKPVVNMTVNRL
jgi:hypothetical protein